MENVSDPQNYSIQKNKVEVDIGLNNIQENLSESFIMGNLSHYPWYFFSILWIWAYWFISIVLHIVWANIDWPLNKEFTATDLWVFHFTNACFMLLLLNGLLGVKVRMGVRLRFSIKHSANIQTNRCTLSSLFQVYLSVAFLYALTANQSHMGQTHIVLYIHK